MGESIGVRERAVFRGRVQGVGFRATCRAVASELSVAGWVRNDADGGVTAEIEGPEQAVERFYERVRASTWGRVDEVSRTRVSPTGSRSGFEIVG
ncbi:MAG: acylphosphatase [Phycisphaerales bacterium]